MDSLNYVFDPEFSEYNPIFAELESIKNKIEENNKGTLISKLVKKLMSPIIIQTE